MAPSLQLKTPSPCQNCSDLPSPSPYKGCRRKWPLPPCLPMENQTCPESAPIESDDSAPPFPRRTTVEMVRFAAAERKVDSSRPVAVGGHKELKQIPGRARELHSTGVAPKTQAGVDAVCDR